MHSYDIIKIIEFLNTDECTGELQTFMKSMDYRHDTKAFSYTHLMDSSLDTLSTYIFNKDVDDELSEKLFSKFPSLNGHSAAHLNKILALRQKFYDMFAKKSRLI